MVASPGREPLTTAAADLFEYRDAATTWAQNYLWPVVQAEIESLGLADRRAFDLGCGNGSLARMLQAQSFQVSGVDPSNSGIAMARAALPEFRFEVGSSADDLKARFGTFPLVVSLEVIEHCYSAHRFAAACFDLLEEGGTLICSTPYHGYLKNLALSVLDKWDRHHTSIHDGLHIKFFSERTLRVVLEEAGFSAVRFVRVGRIPPLAKSLVAIARKPAAPAAAVTRAS
jgi:2-polyprenyl-6-hydroxyphenyl methylase/3-demethylubiquinone-9 3-methyltransferase